MVSSIQLLSVGVRHFVRFIYDKPVAAAEAELTHDENVPI